MGRDLVEFKNGELMPLTKEFSNGLRRLFMLNLPTKKLQRQMPIDHKLCLQYMKIGKNCEQFKQDIPLSQLKHMPRYLKAIQIRLTRLEHDHQKLR
ncbi:DUF3418 domain-containing protein [Candidatus Marithrix sp. Canyon 246]|nr:DUF3418 domain-containing protein [Candidatus Marithrix sp. Canyon 246]